MGVGVAGLQAIATGRRLGAVVTATDVRPATKEQVESLGAKFVAVEDDEFKQAETAGGYAKEMSDAYKAKQAELVASHIAKQDIVVTTALIPGRPAPRLVSADMVKSMRSGSVIVDLAVERGGNCELSRLGELAFSDNGVKIVGYSNVTRIPSSASALYARNLYAFVETLIDKETKSLAVNWGDELVKATCLTRGGRNRSSRLSVRINACPLFERRRTRWTTSTPRLKNFEPPRTPRGRRPKPRKPIATSSRRQATRPAAARSIRSCSGSRFSRSRSSSAITSCGR